MKIRVVYNWGLSRHFEPKKSCKKNRQNSQRFLNYIKSLCIIFCAKMVQHPHIIYYRRAIIAFLPLPSFTGKNWIYDFFLIVWHAPISPSYWMPCYKHFLCLYPFQMLCVFQIYYPKQTLHKKWTFPLRICSVNVTKSAENYIIISE